jgi:hypothetical protein
VNAAARRATALLIALLMALVVSGCAALAPPTQPPARAPIPTAAEQDEVRRTIVAPYLACMQTEARKLGAGGVVGASELRCGERIQALRRYGAAKNYDALRWSDYVEQVELDGQSAAAGAVRKSN